jgi:O-antigen/teichoic acid export membrane protein
MYEGFSEDDKKGGEKVSQFLPVYYFTCLWCVVGTCVLGREAIMILTESSYHGAFVFVPIVALAYLFQAWYRPFNEILNFYKKTVLVSIGSIIQGVANLLLNILLVPKFGAMGASWATFVSLFLLGAFVFVWSQKIYPIHISYYKLIGITMPAVVCYLILYHWSEEIFSLGLLWAILIKGLAVCVFVVLTFVFIYTILGVTSDEKYSKVAGIVIGLSLTFVHLLGIPLTGTSVNPARSLAPAIFTGGLALQQVWLFIVAPLVGSVIATYTFMYLNKEDKKSKK